VAEPLFLAADKSIGWRELVALSSNPLHNRLLVTLLDILGDTLDHLLQGEIDYASLIIAHVVTN